MFLLSHRFRLCTLFLLLQASALTAFATQDLPLPKQQQVLEIKGIELPELLGRQFSEVTLFAYSDQQLKPIPFQFEDFDDEGNTYFPDSGAKLRGDAGVLDEHDSLFIFYPDAGKKLHKHHQFGSRMISEIRIGANDDSRYVYISDQLKGYEADPLTGFDRKTGKIHSPYFSGETNPRNFLVWRDFKYHNFDNMESVGTLMDTLKVRLNAGLLLPNPKITLNNHDLKADVVDVKGGPVRTVLLVDSGLNILGVDLIDVDIRFTIMPKQFDIFARIDMPLLVSKILINPSATITIDAQNIEGSRIYTALGGANAGLVDGRMTEDENKLVASGIDNDNTWIWLETGKNLHVICTLEAPANLKEPLQFIYQDDGQLVDRPERFPGQRPNIGYGLNNLQTDDVFDFKMRLIVADTLGNDAPMEFANALDAIPNITINNRKEKYSVAMSK